MELPTLVTATELRNEGSITTWNGYGGVWAMIHTHGYAEVVYLVDPRGIGHEVHHEDSNMQNYMVLLTWAAEAATEGEETLRPLFADCPAPW